MGRWNVADWVLFREGAPPCFVCERCGAVEPVPLPMPVDAFSRKGKYFAMRHLRCPEREKETEP